MREGEQRRGKGASEASRESAYVSTCVSARAVVRLTWEARETTRRRVKEREEAAGGAMVGEGVGEGENARGGDETHPSLPPEVAHAAHLLARGDEEREVVEVPLLARRDHLKAVARGGAHLPRTHTRTVY